MNLIEALEKEEIEHLGTNLPELPLCHSVILFVSVVS